MPKFLFRFGFCTPAQWKANEENDWDDESSDAVFIEAPTAEVAEEWGCEVAEFLVRQLFAESTWSGEVPSWKASSFAYWVESDITSLPSGFLDKRLTVSVGEIPDFAMWWNPDDKASG